MLAVEDAQLIDALQIAPRAPWGAIGGVLGVSGVTAAKRWQRLTDEGLAWVTAGLGMAVSNAQCLAYVEVTCQPNRAFGVANLLASHGPALTVELTTGNADMLVTVAAVDLPTMSHYLLEHLGQVDGVLRSRVRIVTRLYGEGSSWRLRVLPEPLESALLELRGDVVGSATPEANDPMSESSKAILTHLALDGRISYAELAERAGTSPTTARRRVTEMLQSGTAMLRTDVSARHSGWPVQSYFWADAPVEKLGEIAAKLSQLRQARLTATVAASESMAFCAWLPTVEEVHRLELSIAAAVPELRIVDRLIVLRQIKRNGRLIDESGRAAGVVPINIWDDLLCVSHA
jgi:DNA-binding Lrp family transcriptional regulator